MNRPIMAFLQLPLTQAKIGINSLLKIVTVRPIRHSFQTKATPPSTNEQEELDEDEELNKPIEYSTSPAAIWAARNSFSGDPQDDAPWFEPISVGLSAATFLVYFLYLREANDIDASFDRELGDYFDAADAEAFQKKIAQANYQGQSKT